MVVDVATLLQLSPLEDSVLLVSDPKNLRLFAHVKY